LPTELAGGLPQAKTGMAVLLLALFPILLLYRPRWALAAIALAIVLLYRSRVKTATTKARRRVEEEVYSSHI
jgi:4-hydroxybenzoate polyprenyltransferase